MTQYRFYGQWDPPVDKTIFESFFPTTKGGVFIEAGAADGQTESSCKFFEEFMGWTGYNIEPDPFLFGLLEQNRPNSTNIRVALSDHEGEAEFTKAVHPVHGQLFGNGSLSHTKPHLNGLKNEGCTFEKFTVPITTYSKLIESYQIKQVDLFVLDVEGHKLSTIAGMRNCGVLPHIMCLEHGEKISDIRRVLNNMGYKFKFSLANNSYFEKQ